jgi:PAS domain S-box-containing protein
MEPALLADAQDGRIVAANDAAAELWGRPREQLVGLHQWELHPDQDVDHYRQMFGQHLRTPCDQEAEIRRADGGRLPVRISASLVVVDGRQHLLGLFRDRSGEDATRRKLEEYRAWMQVIADSASVAVTAVDAQGHLTFWNRAAEEMFGWRADEVLGRPNPTIPPGRREEGDRCREEVPR